MSSIDARLIERVSGIRREIEVTERAAPPVDTIVAQALADVDHAGAEFQRSPFQFPHFVLTDQASAHSVRRLLLGYSVVFNGPATRKMIEASVRSAETARGDVLRLTPEQRDAELAKLQASLRRATASLEKDRRRVESLDDSVLPRPTDPPEIWLMIDRDLLATAEGKPLPADD